MANSLFNSMNRNAGTGGMGNIIQQFQQFRNTFQGDPRQQVQNLLNSGKVTQEQYNRAVQMANQLAGILNGKV